MDAAVQQSDEAMTAAPRGRGPRAARAPRRRCIVSRAVLDKSDLLRFVVGPDGSIVFDAAGKLPGRGLWLRADRTLLAQARAKGSFAKAARAAVTVPDDLARTVERILRRRCLDGLGLARRAGLVDLGYEKVRARLTAGRVLLLLQASDAADGGRQKLAALAQATRPAVTLCALFDAADLGHSLGRDTVVHVALGRGGMARRILDDVERLGLFLGCDRGDRQSAVEPADPAGVTARNA